MAKLITLNDLTRFVTNIKNLIKNERTSIENKLTGYVPKKVHPTEYMMYCQRPSGATIDPSGIQMIAYSSTKLENTIAYRAEDGVLRGKTAPLANQEGKDLINREELTEKLGEVGGGLKWVDYSAAIQRKNIFAVMVGIGQTAHEDGSYRFALPPVFVYANDNNSSEYGTNYSYDLYREDYFKTGGKGNFRLNTSGTGYSQTATLYNQTMADGANYDWNVCEIMKMLVKE